MFLYHWREESQHAIMDELEWLREDEKLGAAERDQAVDDLIELVGAVDGILQAQSAADAGYFRVICGRALSDEQAQQVQDAILRAYRWQYIVSGVQDPHFSKVLGQLITPAQGERIGGALSGIVA